jgi:hypothetical protein
MIVEDVDEGASDLERRAKSPRVVPLREDGAAAIEVAVQAARQANREPLHRARERAMVCGFRNEMNMIRLHREVHEPRTVALACRAERPKNDLRQRRAP